MSGSDQAEMGELFERFLAWSRRMGWVYGTAPGHLASFQRFAESRSIERLEQVDAPLLLAYQRHLRASRSATTVNGYLGSLRALWRFLLRDGLVDRDVTAGVPRLAEDHFVPYLYGEQELRRIDRALEQAIRQASTASQLHNRWTWRTAFGLLRDCGLRVSEACRLDLPHYDRQARTLRIERTKFFKSRVIPVPRSTGASLDRYLQHRRRMRCREGTPRALFLSATGRRVGRVTLEHEWKELLCRVGLYRARRRQGRTVFGSTNLHGMRHVFAVRRLERWQRRGRNVEAMLPLLSAYLGHAKVTYTAVYLHLTPALGRMSSERFGRMALPLLDRSGAAPPGDAAGDATGDEEEQE